MIRPGDLPPDDSDFDEADDQTSQQDIHSNGLDDDYYDNTDEDNEPDLDELDQAYTASESAYTLFDDEDEDDDE